MNIQLVYCKNVGIDQLPDLLRPLRLCQQITLCIKGIKRGPRSPRKTSFFSPPPPQITLPAAEERDAPELQDRGCAQSGHTRQKHGAHPHSWKRASVSARTARTTKVG